ncbi:hypothetical protein SARC_10049 [Sphaeroforma arctica JP610]|uniref:Uncharacterized protein n=1 Tax=Sphaeroforma arctica JP610 TaxID=667725 RepID=A0A0L0FLX9_9EUKA|nr:hypothetical protein SARC_10049 [Sphaeroforma arctica JP610]KNC77486.1 hypothetical protein SARC_10049 [Sphaeroforma arctica JP610]|eukprot:XP_014151388.1 hypothetical protein SARC_10049 [Sphaeroforma arctica JP610]
METITVVMRETMAAEDTGVGEAGDDTVGMVTTAHYHGVASEARTTLEVAEDTSVV